MFTVGQQINTIVSQEHAGKLDLYFQIDDYIKAKKKTVTPRMIRVYENMRDTLKAFEVFRKKPITFDDFDFNFYEDFVEYMMYDHVQRRRKINTVAVLHADGTSNTTRNEFDCFVINNSCMPAQTI